ncbi:IclR family transcriptional regulator [Lysinimonas soli]|uniref:IclR family transcriptional regulator n=1 Tax=Lysinimonas soli TaxID=1074233 RepID=A0ABW0NTX8_9MICO
MVAGPRPGSTRPEYGVPALDKAFDVLELLAESTRPLSQTEIAEATGRTVSTLFRVLATLEARGWLLRDADSGLYSFSMAAFDLAHRQPALRGLLDAALPPMRALSERVQQSCNLSVLDAGAVRVIAQVESPADFGYRVRVGAVFPVVSTASGEVLTTSVGSVRRDDPLQAGITDLVAAVRDRRGATRCALTVPYVATSFSAMPVDRVMDAAVQTAELISARLSGTSAATSQPAPR